MRLLGVDYGFKRIGLAIAETELQFTTPRSGLAATGVIRRDAEEIARAARQEEANAIVVGLPLEPDGAVGKMARICRTLAERLCDLGLRVEMVDESLTTVEAHTTLADQQMKASQRRRLADGQAAAIILQRYLDAQAKV